MGIAAMHDARAYAGPERRRNQVFVTENREYHCRDGSCVAVRDRRSRMFIRNHSAIGKKLTGAMRLGLEGIEEVSPPDSLVAGEKLCFSSCDGDLEHDVLTSALVAIERPAKSVVALYDDLRAGSGGTMTSPD